MMMRALARRSRQRRWTIAPAAMLPSFLALAILGLAGHGYAATRGGISAQARRGHSNDWPMYNRDPKATRWNEAENRLSPATVGGLHKEWTFPTAGAVAGTPAVVDNVVYALDSTGTAYAIDRHGSTLWNAHVNVSTPVGPKISDSPLVMRHTVVFGDLGGTIHGLNTATGAERWSVRPNNHPAATIFGSATRVGRNVAVGISSYEEGLAGISSYKCCTFRGSVVLLSPVTGRVIWQRFLVPPPEQNSDGSFGPSGVGVWSTPTYDRATNTIYVATGNNYSAPATGNSDAVVALNASNGRIRWVNQRTADDISNVTYPPGDPNHPDFDFGDSPQIYRAGGHEVVGAGQKSGFYYAFAARTGKLLHSVQVSPGGGLGGLFADTAVAGNTVYANGTHWPRVYVGGKPRGGTLSAIAGDGSHSRWRFHTPKPNLSGVAVANGVAYFQSINGLLYALDARNGKRLARVNSGGQMSGPAISRGHIYLGTGDILYSLFHESASPRPGSIVALGGGAPPHGRCARLRVGTGAADNFLGTSHGDRIQGLGGGDHLRGGRGRDCASGGPGSDALRGGRGHDVLKGGPGPDKLIGGRGNDTCFVSPGRDVYTGCERIVGTSSRR